MRILLLRLFIGWWMILALTLAIWVPLILYGFKEGFEVYKGAINGFWNGDI